ncbi:MAG TPA: ROK family protein [Actinomycetota bacterium]|nr:ROK family protein [Actinomycetota bacterium]
MGDITIGIDVGGTKIQAAAVREERVVGTFRLATPLTGARDVAAAIVAVATAALAEVEAHPSDVRGVGIGAPGAIDTEAGTVSSSPNLPGFQTSEPVPLGAMVSEGLAGAPVTIDNDVRVAILGEWKRGAGRGYRNLLGVWVGTGVGGGLILNGEPYRGQGAAGEIGHIIVKPGGRVCSDGRKGHLEAYAGRGRMEVYARELHDGGRKTDLFKIMEKKGRSRMSSGVVAEALEHKDKLAEELIDGAVWALGVGLATVQNLLCLEAIVIGGGLGDRLGAPFVERIEKEMLPLLFVPDQPPKMLTTEHGDLSGAVGGAVLAGG